MSRGLDKIAASPLAAVDFFFFLSYKYISVTLAARPPSGDGDRLSGLVYIKHVDKSTERLPEAELGFDFLFHLESRFESVRDWQLLVLLIT